MSSAASSPVVLAADIGGTHARFMLARVEGGELDPIASTKLLVAAYDTFEDACGVFLANAPKVKIGRACLALAGPIEGRTARLTNSSWRVDADTVAARFAFDHVELCNDFAAAAAGVDALDASSLIEVQRATPDRAGAKLVIGAGTGLGVAYLLPLGSAARVVAGEGGHIGFAPTNEEQIALWRYLAPTLGRVSAEHLVSGAGLVRLYAFASRDRGDLPDGVRREGAAAVARRFVAGEPAACDALRLFMSIFGAVAGDHALSILASGGVYLTGGIAPRFASRLMEGEFISAFRSKGPHAALMERMPIWLVSDDRLGLLGAARRALAAGEGG